MTERPNKCARPKCQRKGRERNRGLCSFHYGSYRRERQAVGGRLIGRIPAQPVIEHAEKLRAAGLGYRRIAQLSGLTSQTVQRIGRHPEMFVDTAEKILAIPVPTNTLDESLSPGRRVPSLGVSRRLQSLVAIGYSQRELSKRLGCTETSAWKWTVGSQEFVTADVARKVAALFSELQCVPGGNLRAVNRARKHGWVPPLAWSEETIDNPDAVPDVGEVFDWRTNFLLAWEDCRNLGLSDNAAAERLGLSRDALKKRLESYVA